MAKVFISYSTIDLKDATALRQWMIEVGCTDVFLAEHPVDGIAPGEQWRNALRSASRSATAAVFLLSKHWLQSEECWREFEQAYAKKILILPVIIDPEIENDIPEDLKNFQCVRISRLVDADVGYAKLKRSLKKERVIQDNAPVILAASAVLVISSLTGILFTDALPQHLKPFELEKQFVCNDQNFLRRADQSSSMEKVACFGTYLCNPENTMFRDQVTRAFHGATVLARFDMEMHGVSDVSREYPKLVAFLRAQIEQERESKSLAASVKERSSLDSFTLHESCQFF
jgi:hypothetical protein